MGIFYDIAVFFSAPDFIGTYKVIQSIEYGLIILLLAIKINF